MAGKTVAVVATIFAVGLLTENTVYALGPFGGIIKNLLQHNVAGDPIIHKHTEFDFDPDVAKKRRKLYYEMYGFRGENFIERIGVGVDGQEEVRRVQQTFRDQGRLNGEHVINFP